MNFELCFLGSLVNWKGNMLQLHILIVEGIMLSNCRLFDAVLNVTLKVMELDLISLDSVAKFADAWNARMAPLHVLINNAGIFSIGGVYVT